MRSPSGSSPRSSLMPNVLLLPAHMRGEGKLHSDIDLVVLYGPEFTAVRREAHAVEGVPIEVLLHNEQARDFFFDKDVSRGVCIMPSMIVGGWTRIR